jgi:2-haloacid dehalogenase
MAIENIVFDFGGVLVDWNPRHLYASEFADPDEMEYFLAMVCTPEWNLRQDAGRTFAEGIEELEQLYPNYSVMIRKYFSEWHKMLKGEITENVRLLNRLQSSSKFTLFGLTNWSAETMPIARRRFSFLDNFTGIVVSGEEKMVKPDKEIYRLLLKRYHLQAEGCLFIDDVELNILTAREMGFHTIHYHGEVRLAEELERRGIL